MHGILDYQNKNFIISIGLIVSVIFSFLTFEVGFVVPVLSLVIGAVLVFLIIIFRAPFIGLISALCYCFLYILIGRLSGVNFPFGYLIEGFYLLLWVIVIFKVHKSDWHRISNDFCLLFGIWFLISLLELFNPAGANPRGWLHEIRTSGLDSFLLVPLGFLIFRRYAHLNIFLVAIIICSFLATINGFTQIHIGLTQAEQEFLISNPTHSIWGEIRAFSFYRDAGQFGASQAQFAVICGVLALGPFALWKRISLVLLTCLFLYGMLLSGTRGSFFALIPGAFLAIFLFKNMKVFILGIALLMCFLAFLKFTHIGSSNYHIYRFRSALNPKDASLNVRFNSQEMLGEYLKDYPFGGGLGVVGYAGHEYNSDKFLSTIEPDSYWVKVWAMYGIVGFLFWFCMMTYMLGKSCGIIWKIRDRKLQIKLIALASGFFGIFICSYGNEVINALPSSIISYLSLVLICLGPEFDRKLNVNLNRLENAI